MLIHGLQDNVLLEYETALALREAQRIDIMPVLVGNIVKGAYHKFGGFGLKFPETGSKTHTKPISQTMADLFRLQVRDVQSPHAEEPA